MIFTDFLLRINEENNNDLKSYNFWLISIIDLFVKHGSSAH